MEFKRFFPTTLFERRLFSLLSDFYNPKIRKAFLDSKDDLLGSGTMLFYGFISSYLFPRYNDMF
jgi:hypothetical protein